jgi:hypothetical protein
MMQATRPILAAVVISTAVAVAGCGSSSNKTKTSTATTPATSSTPTNSNAGQVPKSARIASPAYYNFALQVTTTSAPYLNASQAKFAAHCIQNRFLSAGFKTQADVERAANSQKLRDISTTCFLKAQSH